MKVKTRIVFEVEYPLDLDFYNTDKEKALEMERALVALNPMEITEALDARGDGTFVTSVEMVKESTGNVRKTWVDGCCTIRSAGTTEV